ncbi:hypothetical protein ACFYXS_39175 [Streptomyces sp. NPDC002574]|uniref:hypothetical protein n=1 Tax=Streptomyces sp. NPDC002574 TaxID=3364652 RepID=UPI00367837E0
MRRGKALPAHGYAPRTAPLVCAVGVALLAAGAVPAAAEGEPAGCDGTRLLQPVHAAGCGAVVGHGTHHETSDPAALARQLTSASTLTADVDPDAYRLRGKRVGGGGSARTAPVLMPGQYTDTIGPGETRWYAVDLDAAATADLAVTAAPRTGAEVAHGDGIELRLGAPGPYSPACGTDVAHFGQDEGAMVLSGAVGRVPSADGHGGCDTAGRYALSVHRTTDARSDRARWPVELRYGTEAPLPAGTTPAPAATRFGEAPAAPAGTPRDVEGGTGFNDAPRLRRGVWRDALLPGRTRFYKVRVGWGQRLVYAAEFANAPVPGGDGPTAPSFVATAAYGPDRQPVEDASGVPQRRVYTGRPVSVGLGTVPVSWTNRWVAGGAAPGARASGDYYVAVSLGPGAARLARDAAVGVVLRMDVTGTELAGPQYKAAARDGGSPSQAGGTHIAAGAAGGGAHGGGFMTADDVIAAGAGGAVALVGVAAVAALSRRRRDQT